MSLAYSHKLPLGWKAPDFKLEIVTTIPKPDDMQSKKHLDKKTYSLSDFDHKQGLMVVFTCNHCPYAQASWPVLVKLYKEYSDEIGFVAINSNDSKQYPQDNQKSMADLISKFGVDFPYLVDDKQLVAKAYQAQCTPDSYLFKNEGKQVFTLQYHGRINDDWQNSDLPSEHSLEHALHNLISDQDPLIEQYPSMGCSIKWI